MDISDQAERWLARAARDGHIVRMGWTPTIALFVLFIALAALAGWRGARPPDPSRGPRLFPARLVMVICAALALYMLVHMVNLAGFVTGR